MIPLIDQVKQGGLVIYKSSAGSGKTYRLVKEYLTLLLADPQQYRHILAITFTNKATEEMKRRILGKLKEFATNDPDYLLQDQMYRDLLALYQYHQPGMRQSLQARARKSLELILNDYSNFSVCTIESFFQRIVRSFTRELNIPLGYEVELSQQLVLEEMVREMLSEIGMNPGLTRLLQQYLTYNLQESRSWNLDWAIKKLGYQVFQEQFQQLSISSPLLEDHIDRILAISRDLQKECRKFEVQMEGLALRAQEIMDSEAIAIEDIKYGKSGVAGYFVRVLERKDYEPKKRALEASENPDTWVKKGSPKFAQIQQALDKGLQNCLEEMVHLYQEGFDAYQTASVVSRSLYAFGMMYDLQQKLTDYRKAHRQLVISDTSYLLSLIIEGVQKDSGLDTPFIYERVGTRYFHYLLDEFQDTSSMQWKNLFPLLKESLAQMRTNLIVGDVKQSIYRWRNGNMELLMRDVEKQIRTELGQEAHVILLKDNWRTAPEIVSFNNDFFQIARTRLTQELGEWAEEEIHQAYESIDQEARRTEKKGLVRIDFLYGNEEEDISWQDQAAKLCYQRIEQLTNEGFLRKDITLLVRNNKEGVSLAQYLQKKGIQIVSAESLLLMRNPKIALLHAALIYLVDTDEAIARATLQYQLNQLIIKNPIDHSTFSLKNQALIEKLFENRHSLQRLPIYECVSVLMQQLKGFYNSDAYVLAFLEAIKEYTHLQDASISGFLAWWEEQKHKRAIASGQETNAVKIMTIHKAKGLEFPVVIVPFTDWPLEPKTGEFLWIKNPQQSPYNELPYLPVQVSSKLDNSLFQEAYLKERLSSYLDNLNLLYVAFTRPQNRLYIQAPGTKKRVKSIKRIAHLLVSGVEVLRESDPQSGVPEFFEQGTQQVYSHREEMQEEDQESLKDLAEKSGKRFPELSIRYYAGRYLSSNILKRSEQMLRGELLHEALGYIRQVEDLPNAVTQMLHQGYLSSDEGQFLKETLEEVISLPEVAHWYANDWEIKNEAEILTKEGNILRPDRVMITEGKAIVVDYKSGKPFDSHPIQVQSYMIALEQMGYQVQGFLYYLQEKVLEVSR